MTTEGSAVVERLVRGAFARPSLVVLLVIGAALYGVVSLQELPRDVFPDLSAPVFNVIVQNPAMSAEELETGIAIPLETALAGLPNVRRIRSNSQLGVVAGDGRVRARCRLLPFAAVRRRAGRAGRPRSCRREPSAPLLSSLTGRLNEIFEFTLEAEPGAADLMTLRDLAEFEVRNRLLAVPGVAAVERLGGYLRQFQVQLDPERMSARGVTLDEVLHAVEGANVNVAGGFVVQGPMEWTVRGIGRAAHGGRPAQARWSPCAARRRSCSATSPTCARRRRCAAASPTGLHGEVVSCRVTKQFGADTVKVAAGIVQRDRRDPSRHCRKACSCASSTTSRRWCARRSAGSAAPCSLGGVLRRAGDRSHCSATCARRSS